MKIKKLRQLQNRILKQAKNPNICRINMKNWLAETDGQSLTKPECRTQACLAGETLIMTGDAKMVLGRYTFNGFAFDEARLKLGLDIKQAELLFYVRSLHPASPHGWPEDLDAAYGKAKTGAERALIVAARLERFIQSNGKE